MEKKKILLGFTTTPNSNWREKIEEIEKFQIKEVAFFPTFLKKEERQELYRLLEKTCLERMPHVHLRDDMDEEEVSYFAEKFGAEKFNIHCNLRGFEFLKAFLLLGKRGFSLRINGKFLTTFWTCSIFAAGFALIFLIGKNLAATKRIKAMANFPAWLKNIKLAVAMFPLLEDWEKSKSFWLFKQDCFRSLTILFASWMNLIT